MNILKKQIKDDRFIYLFLQMYNTHILCPTGFFISQNKRLLSSLFFSNILCNVIFFEIDIYIFNEILLRFNNLKYRLPIKYVRYLNCFLIGISGSYNFVLKIKDIISKYLKLNFGFEFIITNTRIVNSYSNKVKFLGMLIYNNTLNNFLIKTRIFLRKKLQMRKKNLTKQYGTIKKIDSLKKKISLLTNSIDSSVNFSLSLSKYTLNGYFENLINYLKPVFFKSKLDFCSQKYEIKYMKLIQKLIITYVFFFFKINLWFDVIKFFYNFILSFTFIFTIDFADSFCFFYKKKIKFNFFKEKGAWVLILQNYVLLFKNNNLNCSRFEIKKVLPVIEVDLDYVYKQLNLIGVLNAQKKPINFFKLNLQKEQNIVLFFNHLAFFFLDYYRCVDNFIRIQNMVHSLLRVSLIATLKFRSKVICNGKALPILSLNFNMKDFNSSQIQFLSKKEIFGFKKKFLCKLIPLKDFNYFEDLIFSNNIII